MKKKNLAIKTSEVCCLRKLTSMAKEKKKTYFIVDSNSSTQKYPVTMITDKKHTELLVKFG